VTAAADAQGRDGQTGRQVGSTSSSVDEVRFAADREVDVYHRFVARQVRATFAKISAGDWEPMIAGMAARFSYRFYGESSLSGERHTLEGLRRWWERSFRLLPNPTFEVDEVIVAGGPWSTRIATRVRVHAALPDGSNYDNVFMQNLYMRWARITEIHTLEDTAVLQRTLDHLAGLGVTEARAEPITDVEPTMPMGEHNN
jgi:ketosteroid isomerase-like protein